MTPLTAPVSPTPEDLYLHLMEVRAGHPVEETLAPMLASWLCGEGVLPDCLGLSAVTFEQMLREHFPGFDRASIRQPGLPPDPYRQDEMRDLHRLLMQHRSGRHPSEAWIVDILIAGCLGDDHLWQDLGLRNRKELSRLMLENFETLARRNDKDMKWKKFLYKQLCDTEGIYTCRAPSCAVCVDYHVCFGPED